MKRTPGALLPLILFIAFSYWMYDAVFVQRTRITLHNASAMPFDSVGLRVEWVISHKENPFDSVGTGSAHHHFGRMEAGEWKGTDLDLPPGLLIIGIVYRAGGMRYTHSSMDPALYSIDIDLKAEADSALDVRAGEGAL